MYPYKCWAVPSPILYYVHSYGQVHGEQAMMTEIIERGPITCGFASVDDFDYNYRGGIYIDTTNATEMNHDVEVVGWGELDGIKYWRARNSWGTYCQHHHHAPPITIHLVYTYLVLIQRSLSVSSDVCVVGGENGFFRIARGINNMQFESDCVYALFDVHHLEDVLRGKMGGSMFGVVEQRDKIFNSTSKHPHIEDERSYKASKHHHSGEKEDRKGKKRRDEVERVSRGHFGGEPTPDRMTKEELHAEDAAILLDDYHYSYHHHRYNDGQQEVDEHTRERESYHTPSQAQQHQRSPSATRQPSQHSHGATPASHDLYNVALADDSLSEDEEAEQDSIMQAVRIAYAHEKTRKRQPTSSPPSSSPDETSSESNPSLERRERLQDESLIADAIHHALRHSSSRAHVKQMVLHSLHTLEEEAAAEGEVAESEGVDRDAEKEVRERDVAIVEDEVGRMWRQESVNATVDDLDEAIGRVVQKVKEGGKRIVEQMEKTEQQEDDQVEVRRGKGTRKPFDATEVLAERRELREEGGGGMLIGMLVGVVLGVTVCGALMFVLIKQKERHEYMPL